MPSSPTPTQVLRHDHEAAQRLAGGVGKQRTLELLKTAQLGLERRLRTAEGLGGPGRGSFTATQVRSTLAQVRAVLVPLQRGMQGVVVDQGRQAAGQAATSAARYLSSAEQRFRGLGSQRLALDQTRLVDRAVAGTESSVLSRLLGGPHAGKRAGILQRYGQNVVGHFEDILQQRLIQKTPWEEVKQQLIEKSPFLQGAPAHWAERIVRTEVANQAGRASQESIEVAQQTLGDMCKILSTTFDSRTGADSYAVHGQIRRPSESFESWFGSFMHPPDRPNDRGIVVPHRISWPIPAELKPKGAGATASRWAAEGRTGGMPSMPLQTTIPLDQFGKASPAVENPGSQGGGEQQAPPRAQAQVPDVLQRVPERPASRFEEPEAAPEMEPVGLLRRHSREDFEAAGITVDTMAASRAEAFPLAHEHFEKLMGEALTPQLVQDLIGLHGTPIAEGGRYGVFATNSGVSVKFTSPAATVIREFDRHEDELVVHHALFQINDEAKAGGAGKRALRSQVQQYDRLGVKRIETEAAWDGQYVWPRMGFEARDLQQFKTIKVEFMRFLQRSYGMAAEDAVRLADAESIHDLAMSAAPSSLPAEPLHPLYEEKLGPGDLHKAGKRFLLQRGNQVGGPMIELQVRRGEPEEARFRAYLGLPARP